MTKEDFYALIYAEKERKVNYKYRVDPVPGTGKAKQGHRKCKLHANNGRKHVALLASVEMKPFLKGRDRIQIHRSSWDYWDYWDSFYEDNHNDRCWKSNTRHRKQWAKHRNHKPKYSKTGRDFI